MLPGVDNIFGSMENYDKFMENRVNSVGSKIGREQKYDLWSTKHGLEGYDYGQ